VARTPTRFDPADFVDSDGWTDGDFDGTQLLDSPAAAASAWEVCRPATWSVWLERHGSAPCWPTLPPRAAVAHDDLQENAWSITRASTVKEVEAAVAADLAAVDDFARRRPDAARTIGEGLAVLVEDLETYGDLAEAFGDDAAGREHAHFALRCRVIS
jgi:hypothetical protein